MPERFYTAFWQSDHSKIIYRHKPNDGTLDQLPCDAVAAEDLRNTLFRVDGGDPFEFALFRANNGELIVVVRD